MKRTIRYLKSLQPITIFHKNNLLSYICSENTPPRFLNQTKLYAIKGHTQKFNVRAKDPENKVVEYSLLHSETKNKFSISKSGMLEIRSTIVGKFKITIRANDICGAFTDQEFTIESMGCPCEGYCRWKMVDDGETGQNSTEIECVCPKGCTGVR